MKKPTNHEELMEFMMDVPGVREFVESFSVRIGREIMARRIELRLSQKQLAQLVKKSTGEPMTQSMISRIEGGTPGITAETYNRVLRTLGMTDLKIEFGRDPEGGEKDITIKTTSAVY